MASRCRCACACSSPRRTRSPSRWNWRRSRIASVSRLRAGRCGVPGRVAPGDRAAAREGADATGGVRDQYRRHSGKKTMPEPGIEPLEVAPHEGVLTLAEAAAFLRVGEVALAEMAADGAVPGQK